MKAKARPFDQNPEAFRIFVENANDILYTLTPHGEFTYVSPRWFDLLGHEPTEVLGKSFEVFVHPEDVPICRAGLNRTVEFGKKQGGIQYRVQHRDGSWRWHESNASALKDSSGQVTSFLGVARDITETKELERKLFENNEELGNLLLELPVAVMIVDYESRRILELNPKAMTILGYTNEELAGSKCTDYVCPADKDNCPIIDLGEDVNHSEKEVVNASGEHVPIHESAITTHHSGRKIILECFTDISRMKEMECRLQEMARKDHLTGLFNRRYFVDQAKKELERAKEDNFPVSLITFDIDEFKVVNDSYGHPAGDEVLLSLARICQDSICETDVPARVGGEEFGILLPGSDIDQAAMLADRLRKNVTAHAWEFEGRHLQCTISLGVAQYAGPGEELEDLMRRADKALYKAKNNGKNQVCSKCSDSAHK